MIVENFVLYDQNNIEFELYKNLDKKILLVFYPGDNTFICSRQLPDYSRNLKLFEEKGIRIIGINIEDRLSHKSFCSNTGINFPLLADKNKEISRRFDALNIFGINKRKLILISPDREIVYEKTFFQLRYYNSGKVLSTLEKLKLL